MRVLYVCTGNSFRSPVAEALTREYHPSLEVESAGTHPATHIAHNGMELLESVEARQYVKPHPNHITQRAIDEADLIVVFKQRHLEYILKNFQVPREKIVNWDIDDPIGPTIEPEEAFEKIKENVKTIQKSG
jgi:protein-tyrosine phosphatase